MERLSPAIRIAAAFGLMLGALALVAVGSIAYRELVAVRMAPVSSNKPAPPINASNPIACRIMAEKLVGRMLKSPGSAKFAPHDEWKFEVIDANTARVEAWVDSQNGFGALIRTYFTATIRTDGDKWKLKYLKFDDSDDEYGEDVDAKEVERQRLQNQADNELVAKQKARQAAQRTAREAENRAQLKPIEQTQPAPPAVSRESKTKSQQDLLAAERRKRKFQETISRAEFRPWITFGGTKASEAKITNYRDGVFTLTKRDGKTIDVRISRFTKADRAYVDSWLDRARVGR